MFIPGILPSQPDPIADEAGDGPGMATGLMLIPSPSPGS